MAGADNAALTVPAGKAVTLDLAGHTLSRGLTNARKDGNVITVYGSLTVTDSRGGGTITGGNNIGEGGGVLVHGEFTLDGGVVTGNRATGGGGVFCDGTLTLNGGGILGNNAVYTGGVLVENGEVRLSGSPVVQDNTAGGDANNVFLPVGAKIVITGELEEDARVGVNLATRTGVLPAGLSGKGTAENFTSDDGSYEVIVNADGEACLGEEITVTFDSAGGSETESQRIFVGLIPDRPEDPTRAGHAFRGWQRNGSAYGFDTPVWGNTTLMAAWEEIEFAPDFILPRDVTLIEENAFEGIAAGTVYIPDNCVKISTGAFMNCPNLSRIRVPANCEIEEYAFEGCENLYVFSAPESKAKWHCVGHDNCTFVAETP